MVMQVTSERVGLCSENHLSSLVGLYRLSSVGDRPVNVTANDKRFEFKLLVMLSPIESKY